MSAELMVSDKVSGHCPMECGETLGLGDTFKHVICYARGCPRPTAVAELLQNQETKHIVHLTDTEFTILHPLKERLDNALLNCLLHQHLASFDEPPARPGRYRASWTEDGGWRLEEI